MPAGCPQLTLSGIRRVPSSSKMVFTQAFTFKVLGLGAAHVAIGPLFFSVVNDHAMLIDAKDTPAMRLATAIPKFVSLFTCMCVLLTSTIASATILTRDPVPQTAAQPMPSALAMAPPTMDNLS